LAREKDGYRENLELLNVRFPQHDMLSMEQVMEVTGYKSKNTVQKHLGSKFVSNRISKVYLAIYMCG
jgi:hypothetical protein